ncbi:4'-phosphopantetheinyl transferase family protein [Nocardia sp. NPDC052566]|uniref:4'-phosphopantetheinyl transferase family protein n=1 Tax=Nocardia sp. NPDC052566 TaxID=3364330 RepID=UPI0037C6E899
MSPLDVDVWTLPLTGGCAPADRRLLAADELARADRFDAASAAADFVHLRATLRRVLATYTGTPPAELTFRLGSHGKPELTCRTVAFNLTHTRGLALVAVAPTGSVGIDAEFVDAAMDLAGLTARVLTAREAASVGTDRRRFLRHWVAKESYLKWLGAGLTIAPDALELCADSGGLPVISAVGDARLPTRNVHSLDLGARYACALVCDRNPRRVTLRPAGYVAPMSLAATTHQEHENDNCIA